MKMHSMHRYTADPGERGQIEVGVAAAVLIIVLSVMLFFVLPWGGMGDMGDMMRDGGMMGGGSDTSDAPAVSGGLATTVVIEDFLYAPANLRVPVGATVTWRNEDSAPHTATAYGKLWDTGLLGKGKDASISFDQVGDYFYYCVAHPQMKARIQVQ